MDTSPRPARAAPGAPTAWSDTPIGWSSVGVGFSRGGLAALSWATEEALARRSRLTLCHAVPAAGRGGAGAADLAALGRSEPDLVRHIRLCRQLVGGAGLAVELPAGDITAALLSLSRRCDLLVVGRHDGADPRHRSVAARVVAQARCPLVVVRPAAGQDRGPFAGHVVVAVDGTPSSAAALRFGFEHAQRHQLPVAAVHVDDRHPGDYWYDDRFLETHFAAEPAALAVLARQVEPCESVWPGVDVKRAVVRGGVVPALRRAAAGAALLVLARHGAPRPALARPGPVTRAFAECAGCVVAIVPDDSAVPPDAPARDGGAR